MTSEGGTYQTTCFCRKLRRWCRSLMTWNILNPALIRSEFKSDIFMMQTVYTLRKQHCVDTTLKNDIAIFFQPPVCCNNIPMSIFLCREFALVNREHMSGQTCTCLSKIISENYPENEIWPQNQMKSEVVCSTPSWLPVESSIDGYTCICRTLILWNINPALIAELKSDILTADPACNVYPETSRSYFQLQLSNSRSWIEIT